MLLLLGCNPSYPPELPLDAELTRCEQDADCVIVELAACDTGTCAVHQEELEISPPIGETAE